MQIEGLKKEECIREGEKEELRDTYEK